MPDSIKVPAVGTGGSLLSFKLATVSAVSAGAGSMTLSAWSLIGSIVVSAATFIWVVLKCYYLVKNRGK